MALNKDKIREQAQKYLQKGQFDRAIKEFERLLEEDPNDVRTLLKIGDLHIRRNDVSAAARSYDIVAKFYTNQGFLLKAVAVYKQILTILPQQIDVFHRLAELYQQLGLSSDAIGQYRLLADYYEREQRWDDLLLVLQKMHGLDKNQLGIRVKLAEVYGHKGDMEGAKHLLQELLTELQAAHRQDEFAKVAELMLQLVPNHVPTAKALGAYKLQSGDGQGALACLQICFQANQQDVAILTMLAQAFALLQQPVKAIAAWQSLYIAAEQQALPQQMKQALHELQRIDPNALAALGIAPSSSAKGKAEEPVIHEASDVMEVLADDVATIDADLLVEEVAPERSGPATPVTGKSLPEALMEVDVFLRYGLSQHAQSELVNLRQRFPQALPVRERLVQWARFTNDEGQIAAAYMEFAELAESLGEVGKALQAWEQLIALQPNHPQASKHLARLQSKELAEQDEVGARAASTNESGEIAIEWDLSDLPSESTGSGAGVDGVLEEGRDRAGLVVAAEAAAVGQFAASHASSSSIQGSANLQAVNRELPSTSTARIESTEPQAEEEWEEADLTQEIEEIQFLLAQNLYDDALVEIEQLQLFYPEHRKLGQLRKQALEEGSLAAAADLGVSQISAPLLTLDLAAALQEEVIKQPTKHQQISFQDVLAAFQEGVAKQVDAEDMDTHLNLGVAYKEMGLWREAEQEFSLVAQDMHRAVNAYGMLALCALEQGDAQLGIKRLTEALALPQILPQETLSLHYDMAMAYERLGQVSEARNWLEKVAAIDPTFRNTAERLDDSYRSGQVGFDPHAGGSGAEALEGVSDDTLFELIDL